ncbi:TIGR01621 family pseudouridine synthase [Neisseria leonii]|uniref:TIGR01621 family pseudouridine synthase n=1 Tax=Neisseria leonii TaxID=2995413 RepID=UPI00237BC91E|nr:TIGR01621 family pseudouridine synthase [Neisseria sp. 3986]MDD9326036.1 TIGR01621 family pseudouridine synthase [Neisseria sp. 3986]
MFEMVFRHRDFVLIDKAAGVSVHSGENGSLTAAVAAAAGVPRVWLVHRLDKPTSGLLLLALNAEAAGVFGRMFAQRQVAKTYLALSPDRPKKKQGRIRGGMAKARGGAWKLTRGRDNEAVTDFHTAPFSDGLRWFVLRPQTGRTHQLRVAMKSLGSPILGDTLYGGRAAERLFLHAAVLAFEYGGEKFVFRRLPAPPWPPLPDALRTPAADLPSAT